MTDWASLISTGSAAAVGIAGIVATYKAGHRQQETTIQVARLQLESQERLAREERHQARLEKAYEPLLRFVSSEQADRSLTMEEVLREACPSENIVYVASCMSEAVRDAYDGWRAESDSLARRLMAAGIHAQVRRELLNIDGGDSVRPYLLHLPSHAVPNSQGDDADS